jgi:hypothetical protein
MLLISRLGKFINFTHTRIENYIFVLVNLLGFILGTNFTVHKYNKPVVHYIKIEILVHTCI